MKLRLTIILLLLVVGMVTAQTKTAADFPKNQETNKIIEMLAGSWKLQGIVDEEEKPSTTNRRSKKSKGKKTVQVDTDESRNAMQMLEFNPDARYKVNNSTTAIDSGSYRVNEQQGVLYMESDADDVTPTEWKIDVSRKKLTLVGNDAKADARYKYIYVKVKDGVSTN